MNKKHLIAYRDTESKTKLIISFTTKEIILKRLKKEYGIYIFLIRTFTVYDLRGNHTEYGTNDMIVLYYVFPLKNIYVYNSVFNKIDKYINLLENLSKYSHMLYYHIPPTNKMKEDLRSLDYNSQSCYKCHMIILYNKDYNEYIIYCKLFKKIYTEEKSIKSYTKYYYGYYKQKISIDKYILQKYKDFHNRLDYLIDNS